MKKNFQFILLPLLFVFSSLAHAMSLPDVQNVQISNDQLQWNEVADASGYNVYYNAGGPSKFGVDYEYLSTVKGATSFAGLQRGAIYKVIAFNADATLFGDVSSAKSVWLRPDGTADNGNANDDDTVLNADEDLTVTFFGSNNDRYIVETQCNDESTGICVASCNSGGNQGVVTGGFCSANEPHTNASGGEDNYSCFSPTFASVITAGAYCVK